MSDPNPIYNRPGQSALSYRITTRGASLSRMLARLHTYAILSGPNAGAVPLSQLTTRDSTDPALALLDAWAAALDVLSFYEERLANEQYLRTATEDLSVWQLLRTIGYKPTPAIAASTSLVFSLAVTTGSPERVQIAAGSQIKSIPEQSGLPQTFETAAGLEARVSWNALAPRTSVPQIIVAVGSVAGAVPTRRLRFAGLGTGLRSGDVLRVGDATTVRVDEIALLSAQSLTEVTFTVLDGPALALATPAELPAGSSQQLPDVLTLDALNQYILGCSWTEASLSLAIAERGIADTELASKIAALQQVLTVPQVVVAYRQTASFFGADAQPWASLPVVSASSLRGGVDPYSYVTVTSDSGLTTTTIDPSWDDQTDIYLRNKRTIWVDSWGNSYKDQGSGFHLYLARAASGILPGSSLLLRCPRAIAAMTIAAAAPTSVRGYGTMAQTTGLLLSADPGSALLGSSLFLTRDTTAYLQSETLPLAATVPLPDDPQITESVSLSALVLGLSAGQLILVSGEPADAPGTVASEIATVGSVLHQGGYTQITFQSPLGRSYRRSTLNLSANVAPATHGETISGEILGSGDASRANQSFSLKRGPLCYLPAATAAGVVSTLRVRVGGILWKEVDTLLDQDAKSPCYVVEQDETGATTVLFGDGVNGARLPTGQNNVLATYRIGGGSAGNVAASKVQLALNRPVGLSTVKNPLATSGGYEAETLAEMRENGPLSARTLGRVVSLSDYESMADSFPGIAKVKATAAQVASLPIIHLTVATEDGAALSSSSALYQSLLGALRAAGNPLQSVLLDDYRQRQFRCRARLVIDSRATAATVVAAARSALAATFSFASRGFGQPVYASEVLYVLQQVTSVTGVLLDALYYSTDAVPTRSTILTAAVATATAMGDVLGTSTGAELLVIEMLDNTVEIAS